MKENNETLTIKVDVAETVAEPEPIVEVLGGMMELAAKKRWFNEGPGRLDI
ncbi:hypothetical protein HY405_02200 [Candidatus Microgenomates bacterium]|nr:hypothetical protein [Candidatus Microgenomates bacterium]